MKIIAFAGSNSSKSINKKLVTYASSLFENAEVEILDLRDYQAPVFSVDVEKEIVKSKEAKINKLKVVFSSEIQNEKSLKLTDGKNFKKSFYGTNSYMPGLFGLYAAETVIRYLLNRE